MTGHVTPLSMFILDGRRQEKTWLSFVRGSGKSSPLDFVLSSAKGDPPQHPHTLLFTVGLILPAGAVGFGSAVPVGLTP